MTALSSAGSKAALTFQPGVKSACVACSIVQFINH